MILASASVLELATAASIALGAIGSFITTILSQRRLARKVDGVQELVNGRADEQAARIEQLTAALEASDTVVPERPNGPA